MRNECRRKSRRTRIHREVVVNLGVYYRVALLLVDGQVESVFRVHRVVINQQLEVAAPRARRLGHSRQYILSVSHIAQGHLCGSGVSGESHDVTIGSPIVEELSDAGGEIAHRMSATEFAQEIGIAQAPHRFIDRSFQSASKERADRGGHTRDRPDAARDLLDINPRIGWLDRHDYPPKLKCRELSGFLSY